MQELKGAIKLAAKKLFEADIEPELSRPDEKFGDYATNVALQLAKQVEKTPNEIARQLITELHNIEGIEEVSLAGPGFINFKLTDDALGRIAFSATELPKPNSGQEILVEFGDPNPFKEMHIGHLYSYIVGDSISKLLETSGATVRRLSYHGDVGLHVAKTIWAMQKHPAKSWDDLGNYYTKGAQAYENDSAAKDEIEEVNKLIYNLDDSSINNLLEIGSKLSFEHFDKILDLLSIKTDRRYLESQSTGPGKKLVQENTGKVFKQSQGAIIYEGEKSGLHTRVFITSKGLPTYETKDLGLTQLKKADYPTAVRSIIITANEQSEYFRVMLAALAEIDSELASKTTHISHGFVNLSSGKMSSRTGDVYGAGELLDAVQKAVNRLYPDSNPANKTYLAAAKYGFLKHRLGQTSPTILMNQSAWKVIVVLICSTPTPGLRAYSPKPICRTWSRKQRNSMRTSGA